MFKFIKNLLGLGKESNTLTAEDLIVDSPGVEVVEIAETKVYDVQALSAKFGFVLEAFAYKEFLYDKDKNAYQEFFDYSNYYFETEKEQSIGVEPTSAKVFNEYLRTNILRRMGERTSSFGSFTTSGYVTSMNAANILMFGKTIENGNGSHVVFCFSKGARNRVVYSVYLIGENDLVIDHDLENWNNLSSKGELYKAAKYLFENY